MTYSISRKAPLEFLSMLPCISKVLEIGTGEGTRAFTEHFWVTSIDNDPKFHVADSKLITVPLINCRAMTLPNAFWKHFAEATEWYDPDKLREALVGVEYDAIVIDGPSGSARRIAMWWYYERLFNTRVPVIVDDVHRRYDWAVAVKIAQVKRAQEFRVIVDYDKNGGESMFAVIK